MGFHLLAEIAESKTCSCECLTPPPFLQPILQLVSQDAENVKVTHRRREQGAALHCLSQQLPGTQQDTGCHLQQMHHAIKSHHLVTWCASNSDILITLYFICVRRKLHCKSSAMHNFHLIFYHLSHVDPTRPGHTCKFSDLTRPDPTRLDPWVGSTVVQLYPGALNKSSRSLSHLLMSSCTTCYPST